MTLRLRRRARASHEGTVNPSGSVEPDGPKIRLSPKCIVTVRSDGVQLQTPLEAPRFVVGLPELSLLAAIGPEGVTTLDPLIEEVAAQTGTVPDRLHDFVKRLERTDRLVTTADPARAPALVDGRDRPPDAAIDLDSPRRIVLRTPLVLLARRDAFEIADHHGTRVAALTPAEVCALGALTEPTAARDALAAHRSSLGSRGIDEARFACLLARLETAGLLRDPTSEEESSDPTPVDHDNAVRMRFARHAAAQDAAESAREARTGVTRTKVIPVAFDMGAPAGLGMVVSAAKAFDGGRLEEHYDFRTDWVWDDERLSAFTARPAIYLFSNYLWSHARCIAVSQKVKALSPSSITIHGGPDTPKYERDSDAYFAAHPHVDITVRGEGELSAAETLAALVPVIGDPEPDLSVLEGVAGISYRDGDRVVRNPDRERMPDLNVIPSPYLSGLFDAFIDLPHLFVTLETNRGCPYGCTFCDWGSATNSRIRQFDIERVNAEIEWCASARATSVSLADANYGIFQRDVDIAAKVAEVKLATGYPRGFGMSFAKNTVKHLTTIISVLADAGILTQGVLSLQSMDQETLDAIHRSNIKTQKYDDLADEMRRSHLPLMIELMLGLPGSTLASFTNDLQECVDRELPTRVNHTTLLVNSPMNDPDYVAEHEIETSESIGPGRLPLVMSTSSFTRDDLRQMNNLRLSYLLFENFACLRVVSRFVRQETGMREMDFYARLRATAFPSPTRWPLLHVLVTLGSAMMTAPYSWAFVMDELEDFLVSELGLAQDTALDSVLRAQHALLPAHGRRFPFSVQLDHDVVAWHSAMIAAKESGLRAEWTDVVPRVSTFGPGELVVDDTRNVADNALGINRELNMFGLNWELDSPMSRAVVHRDRAPRLRFVPGRAPTLA